MTDKLIKSKLVHDYLRDPSALAGSFILLFFILAALFGPLAAPQNPYDLEKLTLEHFLTPPIWIEGGKAPFILGTDDQGRDILSTILYGCRTSLIVGFGVVLIAGTFGVTMGLLAVPTMLRRGYQEELATGMVSASGTLGQIIPPSIVLVLLATIVQVPVGDLFMAAVFPGLILVVLYIVWIIIAVLIKPKIAPAIPREELGELAEQNLLISVLLGISLPFIWITGLIYILAAVSWSLWIKLGVIAFSGLVVLWVNYKANWKFFLWIGKALFPPILLIIFVLGSIFAGVASPTEAAAVGCVIAVVLAIFKGKFNLKMLREVNIATTKLTCMVFIILVGASAFGLTFRELDGDELVREFLFSIEHKYDKWVVLAIVMGIIFLVGFVLDFIEITFIHVPVLVPILIEDFGFDPLWVCVLLAVNLQTSFMTPPFGFSLFYLKAVTPPEVRTGHIYRGIIPFVIFQVIGLFIVAFWPELATWLPSVVYE